MTAEKLYSFVRGYEDPCVTATEVAKEFGMTPEGANYRLNQLKEDGKVEDKRVGASAKVWYPVG